MAVINVYFNAGCDSISPELKEEHLQAFLNEQSTPLQVLAEKFGWVLSSRIYRAPVQYFEPGQLVITTTFLEIRFQIEYFRLDHAYAYVALIESYFRAALLKRGLQTHLEYHLDQEQNGVSLNLS